MNSERDNETDNALHDAWRSTQDLQAPRSLDRAVLAAAKKAPRPGFAGLLTAWTRPLAFVATLLVGVALLYEIQTPTSPASDAAGRLRPMQDEATSETAPAREAEQQGMARDLEERSLALPRAAAPEQVLRATPEDARAAREQKSESDQARQQRKSADEQPARSRTTLRDSASAAATRSDAFTNVETSTCSVEQRASASTWWRCVEALRTAGRSDEATAELARLQAAFPDFAVPE